MKNGAPSVKGKRMSQFTRRAFESISVEKFHELYQSYDVRTVPATASTTPKSLSKSSSIQ